MKGVPSDTRELLKAVKKAGGTVTKSRKHLTVATPQGPVTVPFTPSDHRSLSNAAHELTRHGLRFTFKGKQYG